MGDDAKANLSKRKQARYAVSEDSRLRAAIRLESSDAGSANKDWSGPLIDLSATGAHIQISMGAVAYKGNNCVLKLSCGAVSVKMQATLAHYICSARYSVCGVKFDYPGAEELQPFLKAIMASATLKLESSIAESPGYREEYRGPGFTKLVIWRDNKPERTIVGFEYTMGRYCAMLTGAGPDMLENKGQVRFKAFPTEKGGEGAPLSSSQVAEARWEFSLAASNLPKAIAPDVRKFLRLVS